MCYLFHPTFFTDNSSIIFFNSSSTDYATEFIATFVKLNLQFAINSLSLNLKEINYVHFTEISNTKIDSLNMFKLIIFIKKFLGRNKLNN
jgi:hypothetical protein